jgi:hypothetical protein
MPEKPWQGGPPQMNSTSPGSGSAATSAASIALALLAASYELEATDPLADEGE